MLSTAFCSACNVLLHAYSFSFSFFFKHMYLQFAEKFQEFKEAARLAKEKSQEKMELTSTPSQVSLTACFKPSTSYLCCLLYRTLHTHVVLKMNGVFPNYPESFQQSARSVKKSKNTFNIRYRRVKGTSCKIKLAFCLFPFFPQKMSKHGKQLCK